MAFLNKSYLQCLWLSGRNDSNRKWPQIHTNSLVHTAHRGDVMLTKDRKDVG